MTSQPPRRTRRRASREFGVRRPAPLAPKSSGVETIPWPKKSFQSRLTKTRAVSGLSRETTHAARSSRVARRSRRPGRYFDRNAGTEGVTASPESSSQLPRFRIRITRGSPVAGRGSRASRSSRSAARLLRESELRAGRLQFRGDRTVIARRARFLRVGRACPARCRAPPRRPRASTRRGRARGRSGRDAEPAEGVRLAVVEPERDRQSGPPIGAVLHLEHGEVLPARLVEDRPAGLGLAVGRGVDGVAGLGVRRPSRSTSRAGRRRSDLKLAEHEVAVERAGRGRGRGACRRARPQAGSR